MKKNIVLILLVALSVASCETAIEKKQRLELEELRKTEIKEREEKIAAEKTFKQEQERIAREKREYEKRLALEKRIEKERKEKAIYNKYINNTLTTGATPYAYCFGRNESCSDWGCSQIKVRTPINSDVMVTIKKYGKVYRHAYIKSGSSYTFEFPNGVYQAFFYYGRGWNPKKVMKETECGTLYGGFITSEHFGKDNPQSLRNNVLNYELILQQNGNFSTKPSNPEEAF